MWGTSTVRLPGGVWRDGARHQTVRIRPPNGFDEEWVVANGGMLDGALATGLLERCVVDLADHEPTAADIDALGAGDREALLWHLHRLAFGESVDAVLGCRQCGEKLDVSLPTADLLSEPYHQWAELYTDEVAGRWVTYRLPTGAAQLAAIDEGGPGLLAWCVVEVDGDEPGEDDIDELLEPLGELMAQRDPQAESLVVVTCPNCEAENVSVLDAFSFLHEELVRRSTVLLRQVHTLAWHYHWSEAEILGLSSDRRQAYLELVAEAYEEAGR